MHTKGRPLRARGEDGVCTPRRGLRRDPPTHTCILDVPLQDVRDECLLLKLMLLQPAAQQTAQPPKAISCRTDPDYAEPQIHLLTD